MDKKESKFKHLLPILLIIVIVAGLIGGGSLAYITREDRARNTISSGEIKVKLYNMLDENTAMPEKGIYGVLANISYPNIVYAHNDCDYPEFIRMRISKKITDREGNQLDTTKIVPDINTDDWIYKEDGYYYYNHVLAPHSDTTPLYETLYFDKSINNDYKTATLQVHIVVEAVQSDNNSNSALEAEGWEVKDIK